MSVAIDDVIQDVERMYRSIAGRDPLTAEEAYAPLPKADATGHVETQLERLIELASTAPLLSGAEWAPKVCMSQSRTETLISLEVPGVKKDNIHVSLDNNELIITGNRRRPGSNGTTGHRIKHNERSFGRFRRAISVPNGLAKDKLTAQLQDGVLEIRFPTPGQELRRKVAVS